MNYYLDSLYFYGSARAKNDGENMNTVTYRIFTKKEMEFYFSWVQIMEIDDIRVSLCTSKYIEDVGIDPFTEIHEQYKKSNVPICVAETECLPMFGNVPKEHISKLQEDFQKNVCSKIDKKPNVEIEPSIRTVKIGDAPVEMIDYADYLYTERSDSFFKEWITKKIMVLYFKFLYKGIAIIEMRGMYENDNWIVPLSVHKESTINVIQPLD